MSAPPRAATIATPSAGDVKESAARTGVWKYVDNRWVVLGTLFFVTAALGLPVLWASRGFSRTSKVVLSLVVLAYTALILFLFYLLMAWAWGNVQDALQNM